jgi:hypothetical protein
MNRRLLSVAGNLNIEFGDQRVYVRRDESSIVLEVSSIAFAFPITR